MRWPLQALIRRELGVAAHRRRLWLARVGWIGGLGLLALFWSGTAGAPELSSLRQGMYVFISLLMAGYLGLLIITSTAHVLERERRENTLELLWLTDLTPRQVVAGLWLAVMLRVALMLLAVVPVLLAAITFGGIAPEQVVGLALELLWAGGLLGATVLLLGAAGGSALSSALTALLLCAGFMLGADALSAWGGQLAFWGTRMRWVLGFSRSLSASGAWQGRAVELGGMVGLLLLAGAWLRRSGGPAAVFRAELGSLFSGPRQLRLRRPRWFDRWSTNPVFRLSARRTVTWSLWLLVGMTALVFAGAWVAGPRDEAVWMFLYSGNMMLFSLLSLMLLFQFAALFTEEARNGTLPVLLGTPLSDRAIAGGLFWGRLAPLLPLLLGLVGLQLACLPWLEEASFEVLLSLLTQIPLMLVNMFITLSLAAYCSLRCTSTGNAILHTFLWGFVIIPMAISLSSVLLVGLLVALPLGLGCFLLGWDFAFLWPLLMLLLPLAQGALNLAVACWLLRDMHRKLRRYALRERLL